MAELEKVRRILDRELPGAPHETLISIDATTGQNGMRQAREFAAVAIANELGIPIKLVSIGESVDDLQPLDADDFLAALSIGVMEKLGLHRGTAADFDHRRMPPGSPLHPHVVYRIPRPAPSLPQRV